MCTREAKKSLTAPQRGREFELECESSCPESQWISSIWFSCLPGYIMFLNCIRQGRLTTVKMDSKLGNGPAITEAHFSPIEAGPGSYKLARW